jgi:hypothetical protein
MLYQAAALLLAELAPPNGADFFGVRVNHWVPVRIDPMRVGDGAKTSK